MTFRSSLSRAASLLLAACCFWIASAGVAAGQSPILLAEKNWAVGYILVGLFIFLGLLSICIPRLRRIEMVDEDEKQPAQKGAAAQAPNPFGSQYGQFGQPAQAQPRRQAAAGAGGKSRMVAGLLGLFLGGWGVHRFYLGYPGIGAAMIGVTLITCGIGAWWGLIDAIMIWSGGGIDSDGEGNPLGP